MNLKTAIGTTQIKQGKQKLGKKLTEPQRSWKNFKWPNTHKIGISQKEKVGGTEKSLKQ